jgi:Co/Zn/Cd efflux system component
VYALSAHVVIDDRPVSGSRVLLDTIRQRLADRFKILHSTIQLECARCDLTGACSLPVDIKNSR